jgi:hypothetical protein
MWLDISKIDAIDPPGCGCMECITGEYVPLDSPYINEVFEAILNGEITPRNNQNDGTLIIYRMDNGRIYHMIDSRMLRRSDYVIITPNDEYADEESEEAVIDISTIDDTPDDTDEEEKTKSDLITSIVDGGTTASNPTYDTYIAYRSPYGETGIIDLPGVQNEADIAILLYDD